MPSDGGRPRGFLSKEEIAAVIQQHQNEIKACYEHELNHRPGTTGKVTMVFAIEPDGSVSGVGLASYPRDDAAVAHARRLLHGCNQGLALPASEGRRLRCRDLSLDAQELEHCCEY